MKYITIHEAAKLLSVHSRTIMRRIEDGSLRAYRFGRIVRIREDHLLELLEPVKTAGDEAGRIMKEIRP